MKKALFLITLITIVAACGRIDKQYDNVISDTETETTQVFCLTLAGIPTFCAIQTDREIRIPVVEIVEQIVREVVVETQIREIEIEKIVKVVETRYQQTPVDVNELVNLVISNLPEGVTQQDYDYNEVVDTVEETIEEQVPPPVETPQDTVIKDVPVIETPEPQEEVPPTTTVATTPRRPTTANGYTVTYEPTTNAPIYTPPGYADNHFHHNDTGKITGWVAKHDGEYLSDIAYKKWLDGNLITVEGSWHAHAIPNPQYTDKGHLMHHTYSVNDTGTKKYVVSDHDGEIYEVHSHLPLSRKEHAHAATQ